MAKKKSKEELDMENASAGAGADEEEGGGSKIVSIIIAVVIIAIWLVILGLLIKMDVGGVGSMLRPYLKNVPGINMILPEPSDDEVIEESGYNFKNLAEAVERIKELEKELANYQTNGNANSETIQQLQAEVARLKTFEENAQYYQELKDKFDREVVYAEKAPDIENYKDWYEKIDKDNAAKLYEQVIKDLTYAQKIKDWAEAYSKMEPKAAAAILQEMTGDLELVAKILNCMTSKQRAAVLAEMDTIFAAKITKYLYP